MDFAKETEPLYLEALKFTPCSVKSKARHNDPSLHQCPPDQPGSRDG